MTIYQVHSPQGTILKLDSIKKMWRSLCSTIESPAMCLCLLPQHGLLTFALETKWKWPCKKNTLVRNLWEFAGYFTKILTRTAWQCDVYLKNIYTYTSVILMFENLIRWSLTTGRWVLVHLVSICTPIDSLRHVSHHHIICTHSNLLVDPNELSKQ